MFPQSSIVQHSVRTSSPIDLYVRRPNQRLPQRTSHDKSERISYDKLRIEKKPTAITSPQAAITRVPITDGSPILHVSPQTPTQLPNKRPISYQIRESQQLCARRHIHRHRQVRPLARHQLPQPLSGGVLRQFRPVPIRNPFPFGRVLGGVGQRNGRGGGLVLEDEALDRVGDFGRELLVLDEHVHNVAQRQSGVELQAVPGSRKVFDLKSTKCTSMSVGLHKNCEVVCCFKSTLLMWGCVRWNGTSGRSWKENSVEFEVCKCTAKTRGRVLLH